MKQKVFKVNERLIHHRLLEKTHRKEDLKDEIKNLLLHDYFLTSLWVNALFISIQQNNICVNILNLIGGNMSY